MRKAPARGVSRDGQAPRVEREIQTVPAGDPFPCVSCLGAALPSDGLIQRSAVWSFGS